MFGFASGYVLGGSAAPRATPTLFDERRMPVDQQRIHDLLDVIRCSESLHEIDTAIGHTLEYDRRGHTPLRTIPTASVLKYMQSSKFYLDDPPAIDTMRYGIEQIVTTYLAMPAQFIRMCRASSLSALQRIYLIPSPDTKYYCDKKTSASDSLPDERKYFGGFRLKDGDFSIIGVDACNIPEAQGLNYTVIHEMNHRFWDTTPYDNKRALLKSYRRLNIDRGVPKFDTCDPENYQRFVDNYIIPSTYSAEYPDAEEPIVIAEDLLWGRQGMILGPDDPRYGTTLHQKQELALGMWYEPRLAGITSFLRRRALDTR